MPMKAIRTLFSCMLAMSFAAACSSGTPVESLCDKLANGPGCKGTDSKVCQSIAKQELLKADKCSAKLDSFFTGAAKTEIYCSGGKAHVPGGPAVDGPLEYSAGGYTIDVVSLYSVYDLKDFLECSECGRDAAQNHGVGSSCSGSDCETGLKCLAGLCTRTCTDSTQCKGIYYSLSAKGCTSYRQKTMSCEMSPKDGMICLQQCEKVSDCGSNAACTNGFCVPT